MSQYFNSQWFNRNTNFDPSIYSNFRMQGRQTSYNSSKIYKNQNNQIKKKKILVSEKSFNSSNLNPKTEYYGGKSNQTFNNINNNEYNKLPNPPRPLINENRNNNKKFQYIDFKKFDLNSSKEYNSKKLYIINENDFTNLSSKITTQIWYSTFKFYTSSEEVKELIQNNINFILVNKKFLESASILSFYYEGNHVSLYEIDQKTYIFFPKEENLMEIPKKNDISSNEKNNNEYKNLSMINFENDNNKNSIQVDSSSHSIIIENQICDNDEDEKITTIKSLILLYGFQKNFIKLMNSPIVDEFDLKKYYLINRNWIEEYKSLFKFKDISNILDGKNNKYNYSYNGFSKNINKIIKDIKTYSFQNQNLMILNNTNDFYPEEKKINKNQNDLIYPTNFELVPEDLFNLLFKKAKTRNLKIDDYSYQVLIGDNVLFIQNKKINNIFYAYTFNKDSCLEIFCSLKYFNEENFYKDVRKYIKEKGFINFLMEREIEMTNYNKSHQIQNKEKELIFEFLNLSNISLTDFEALKIKYYLKSNKKLLSCYNDFIKNCLLLKDNKKDITNFNDILLYMKSKDFSSLPVIIVLKKNLDKLKQILFFNEIEQLSQFEGAKYGEEEEKIIKNLGNKLFNIKEFRK